MGPVGKTKGWRGGVGGTVLALCDVNKAEGEGY